MPMTTVAEIRADRLDRVERKYRLTGQLVGIGGEIDRHELLELPGFFGPTESQAFARLSFTA